MKKTILLITLFVFLSLIGCRQLKYVPVESVRTEYRDNYLRDSVYLHDSVTTVVQWKGDTVFAETTKYKYLYRDRIIRDSIAVTDSVRVPYPVEIEKPVKYVSGWQNFQIWIGRIFGGIVLGYILFLFVKRKLIK
jgi:hypothetical protein